MGRNKSLQHIPVFIIHCDSSKLSLHEKLTSPKNLESWITLLAAAKVGHHEPILKLANTLESEQDVPELYNTTDNAEVCSQ